MGTEYKYMSDGELQHELDKCLRCPSKPCKSGCPVACSPADFITASLLNNPSDLKRAADMIMSQNPWGGVCGVVCSDQHCMAACVRKDIDTPVNIPKIQAAIIHRAREQGLLVPPKSRKTWNSRIAVVGAGPSGLSAAACLCSWQWGVDVFEKRSVVGGACNTIPDFRLPKEMLIQDIEYIKGLGDIQIINEKVKSPVELLEGGGYAGVVIAAGLSEPIKVGILNESEATTGALDFLWAPRHLRDSACLGRHVVVVGAGPVAVDCATSAARSGACHVTMMYRRSNARMPIRQLERSHLLAHDVDFVGSCLPVKVGICGEKEGAELESLGKGIRFCDGLTSARCGCADGAKVPSVIPGTEQHWPDVSLVIIAAGNKQVFKPDPEKDNRGKKQEEEKNKEEGGNKREKEEKKREEGGKKKEEGEKKKEEGEKEEKREKEEKKKGKKYSGLVVYAGDGLHGASTVVEASASGKKAAAKLYKRLTGKSPPADRSFVSPHIPHPLPDFMLPSPKASSSASISGVYDPLSVDLRCSFFGRALRNPFLLSASPLTDGYEQMKLAYDYGWAGGVMKTAFDGLFIHIPSEYMTKFGEKTYGNCDNVSGHCLDRVCSEVRKLVEEYPDRLTMASTGGPVTGNDEADAKVWVSNTKKLESAGAMGVEFSLSCPQGGDGTEGSIVAQSPSVAAKVVEWVLSGTDGKIPKLFKLTSAVTSIELVVRSILEVFSRYPDSLAGITLGNSFPVVGFKSLLPKDDGLCGNQPDGMFQLVCACLCCFGLGQG